jgi:hypothetical protein
MLQALSCLQRLAAGSHSLGSVPTDPRMRELRKAGNGGWYWEVNRLPDLSGRITPFFDRFPIVGRKAEDYRLWKSAVMLLSAGGLSDQDYHQVLALRERMNRGGKRRYRMDGILRDYTPSPGPRAAMG